MGNANTSNRLRASLLALLGLALIGAGLSANANAATSCTSQIQNTKNGAYQGCLVKMGNREFTVSAAQSSAEGCSQVCSIMAEVGGSGTRGRAASKTPETFRP